MRHTGNGDGLSSGPSLSWVGVGERAGLVMVAGGSPFAGAKPKSVSGEEGRWAHPALVRGVVAVVGSGADMGGGGFLPAGDAGVGVNAEVWVGRRLERAEVGEPSAVRAKGFVVVAGAGMSGKGGDLSVPGCSRSCSSIFASSLSGLLARALELLLGVRGDFVFVERAMVVVCVSYVVRVVKGGGSGV